MGGAFDEVSRAAVAPILTFVTAIARSMYYGRKRWPARIIEGVLLALATVAIRPALVYIGMSDDMAVFFGVAMGFVGVDTLSEWLKKWGDNRVSGGK
jgi:lambda family phage holin